MFPCFHSISPYFYVYVSKLPTLFHHIVYVYVSMISLYFTIYSYVYVSKLPTLFHHTICIFMFPCFYSISPYFRMFMFPNYLHYFTILICYVSKLSLYFTISCMFMFPHSFVLFHRAYLVVRVMFPYLYAISPYTCMFMFP
jgi:hypothetical protein